MTAHEYLPKRLFQGVERSPDINGALNKLAVAGGSTPTPEATLTPHPEKIDHIMSKLQEASITPPKHHLATKWYILIGVIGGLLLLSVAIGAWVCFRRSSQRRKYAELNPKGKNKTIEKSDVFNADMRDTEHDRLDQVIAPQVGERNFENGYDNVDTSYEGAYRDADLGHGDKRNQYEA